jgi:tetratricopeptide (TPR) repeat protein
VLNQRFPDIGSEDTTLQLGTFVVPNETLAEAVSPNPDWKSADDLFEAGNQLFNGGDISSAVDRYREALELDTGFLPARYNLGLALNKLGESHEARQTLLSVVEREAGHYEALYQLGALAEADNDADLAQSYFERALAVRPKFEAAREALSRLKG